jgi:hypothetical protein
MLVLLRGGAIHREKALCEEPDGEALYCLECLRVHGAQLILGGALDLLG